MASGERKASRWRRPVSHSSSLHSNFLVFQTMAAFFGGVSKKKPYGSVFKRIAPRRGTISLNWRLLQAPPSVRDYIILHELMHLREMNHSPRFWREVERVCPNFQAAELWLKEHDGLLK